MTDAEIGRMIIRLRSAKSGKGRHYVGYPHYAYVYEKRERVWTDQQIMSAFGLTPARFKKCIKARERELTPWNERRCNRALSAFVKREGRWPNSTDLRTNKNLPYDDTIQRHIHGRVGGWLSNGREGLNEWISNYALENIKTLAPDLVFTIPNITIRREIMDSIGIEKLIKNGGGEAIQQDDFGILWKLAFREGRDTHAMYVEVVNSTPNEKGVYDHYFLRVPPNTKTAKDGVAWTFNKRPEEFVGFAAQS